MKSSGSGTVLETLPTKETRESAQSQSSQHVSEARLQDLIPIAMVIVGGCEPCAESMVNRALQQGSSWQEIDKTLRIVASMQKADCFVKAVGKDVIARMEKPLAAGRRSLQRVMASSDR
jgi:alkylhydroperoxidase/carboxymuconolactone decarboxylase family protein YurZ